MSGSSKNLKNYFISDSVLEAFISDSGGNGGYQLLYFIKEDGTLNQFCIDCIVNDDEKEIKTTEYKNIINFVSTTAGPLFIDIDLVVNFFLIKLCYFYVIVIANFQ